MDMLGEAKHDKPDAVLSENDVVMAWLWKNLLPPPSLFGRTCASRQPRGPQGEQRFRIQVHANAGAIPRPARLGCDGACPSQASRARPIVTNLTRMPIRELDFGAGAPADFSFHSDVSGSAALLPANTGIEVVALHPSILV
jgi:hypothetical protein